jgi:hypothetical protein
VAFVGHLCTRGDDRAEDVVFAAALRWAAAEGAEVVLGPIDGSTAFDYRLLTAWSGRPRIPFPGEPYNPRWLPARIDRQGFALLRRYNSRYVSMSTALAYRDQGLPKARRLQEAGYRIEPLTTEHLRAIEDQLVRLMDAAYRRALAYTPLAVDRLAVRGLEPLFRRALLEASPLVRGPGGDLAGCLLVFPHWGPLVAGPAGLPLDQVDTAVHLGRLIRTAPLGLVVKTATVAEGHQSRGLLHAMVAWSLDATVQAGLPVDHAVAATMTEDSRSQHVFGGRADTRREYALYARPLPNT